MEENQLVMLQYTTQCMLIMVQWFKTNKELQEEEMMSTLLLTEDEPLNKSYIEISANSYY